jgi:hypothetical protein
MYLVSQFSLFTSISVPVFLPLVLIHDNQSSKDHSSAIIQLCNLQELLEVTYVNGLVQPT